MAQRRMFSLQVVDTDKFIEMSISARLLYYELGMRADDDGFVSSPKKTVRSVGCSDDDLKLLIAKGYIIPFDSGIIVIRHWKMNNYIQADRYKKTIYQTEAQNLSLNDNVYISETEYTQDVSIGKDRIGKDRIGKDNNTLLPSSDDTPEPFDCQNVVDSFNLICKSLPKVRSLSEPRKRKIKAVRKILGDLSFDGFFQKVEKSDFLTGRSGKDWKADFDFILQPQKTVKIIEGSYDNKQPSPVELDYSGGF